MRLKTIASVADILEREIEPMIEEWLRRVNLVPELTNIPLSDTDRTGHLTKLYSDLISRLRLTNAKGLAWVAVCGCCLSARCFADSKLPASQQQEAFGCVPRLVNRELAAWD